MDTPYLKLSRRVLPKPTDDFPVGQFCSLSERDEPPNTTDNISEMSTSTSTSTSTLRIHGAPELWEATAYFEHPAEAKAFAALFPNAAGLSVHGANACARATLRASAANGGVNEAGLRRYRTLVSRAEKLGVSIVWSTTGAGSRHVEMSQDDFERIILART